MQQFCKLENVPANLIGNAHFEEGYRANPIDNNQFYAFVANEGENHYVKVALDADVDLSDGVQFPETNSILNKHCQGQWENHGIRWHNYKYVKFGLGDASRQSAITMLRTIVCDMITNQ